MIIIIIIPHPKSKKNMNHDIINKSETTEKMTNWCFSPLSALGTLDISAWHGMGNSDFPAGSLLIHPAPSPLGGFPVLDIFLIDISGPRFLNSLDSVYSRFLTVYYMFIPIFAVISDSRHF